MHGFCPAPLEALLKIVNYLLIMYASILLNFFKCTCYNADSVLYNYYICSGNSPIKFFKRYIMVLSDFDFSGKRVKYLGKSQSKFALSYLIGCISPLSCYSIYPDAYPYDDYAFHLKELLIKKHLF